MRSPLLVALGGALALAGGAAASIALDWMVQVGTCASGGPFQPVRECPENAPWRIALLAGAVAVAGLGVALVVRGIGVPRATLGPAVNTVVGLAILMLVPGLVIGALTSGGIDSGARVGVLTAAGAVAVVGLASAWFTQRRYGGFRAIFAPRRDRWGAPV